MVENLWELYGQNNEDITGSYVKFIEEFKQDCHTITFWADNCSAQNKNWTLYMVLCQLVYDPKTSCNTITIKYFEPGHTFMAADSFHKRVKDEMRKMNKVLDFLDFEQCTSAAGISLKMSKDDFYNYKSKLSHAKYTSYPHLEDVVVIEFRRGKHGLVLEN